jgi:hypothetical protein
MISAFGGLSGGSGGKVAAGPGNGMLFGGRFDISLGGPGAMQVGVGWASLDRTLIDATADSASQIIGVEQQSVIVADVGFNLILTGQKTWYGFAPYFGASVGVALGGELPNDTLPGLDFGTKFHVGPQIGFRWHPSRRIFIRVEGRDVLWKLSYPDPFFEGDNPVLDPAFNRASQWTHNPMLLVSLGFAIPR